MPAKTKGVFNDKEIRTIFSNIEQIRDLSRELFTAIRQQMLNWTDQCMVGDIFTRNVRRPPGLLGANARIEVVTGLLTLPLRPGTIVLAPRRCRS